MIARQTQIREVREQAIVRLVVPHLDRVAGRDIRLPHRQVVAAPERRLRQPRDVGDSWCRLVRATSSRLSVLRASVPTAAPTATGFRTGLEGRTIRHADAATTLLRLLPESQTRPPHEDDAPAVGGPERARVEVHARRHVLHRPRRDVVDHDEAVIGARADERDLAAVRRPLRTALHAPLGDEWLLAAVHFARRTGSARDQANGRFALP